MRDILLGLEKAPDSGAFFGKELIQCNGSTDVDPVAAGLDKRRITNYDIGDAWNCAKASRKGNAAVYSSCF